MGKQKKSPGRPGTTLKTLLLFVGFVGSFIVVQTWWEIRQDRQLTIDAERASSMAAVRSVQEHAERIFGELDQLLWSGAEHIHGAGPDLLDDDQGLYRLLSVMQQRLPTVMVLRYIDRNGNTRASSLRALDTTSIPEDHKLTHVDGNPARPGLFVGQLMRSRYNRELVLPVAMNLYDSSSRPIGLLVAELKAATFFDFYKRITNFEAIVSLRTDSGSMMLRSPFEERWLSISLADAKSMARIRAGAEEGAFEEISHLTGEPLLFSYKRLDKWSLVAVYARRMDDVLAPWRSRTENRILLATGILGFILIALIAFLVYYRYQRRLDHALSSSEYRYRKLYEEGSDPIVLISSELRYLDCNAAALRFFGVPDKERIIGRKVGLFSRQKARQSEQPDIDELVGRVLAGQPQQFEWVTVRRNKIIHTDVTLNRAEFERGYAIFAILRDISARKRAELLQSEQNRVLHMVMADDDLDGILNEIVGFADAQLPYGASCVMLVNEQASHFTSVLSRRYPPRLLRALQGMPIRHGCGVGAEAALRRGPCIVTDIARDPVTEHLRVLIDVEVYPSCGAWPIMGKEGQLLGVFAALLKENQAPSNEYLQLANIAADLASVAIESRRADERIRHLAHYDELTGLPNRFLCTQHVSNAITHAEHRNGMVAVLLMDLDRFKNINDTFGHEAGEAVLQEIAQRFRNTLRELDILARVGGDEFIVLVDDFDDPLQLGEIAQKLLTEARKPFIIDGQEAMLSASIGIATYPGDGDNAQTLIKNADIAMYRAKHHGKDDYRFFSDEVNTNTVERIAMEAELRRAIERGEFVVHYQPKINLATGGIVGAEALVRWQHPVRGLVPPGEFIPLAEETRLIDQIGLIVLEEACRDIGLMLERDLVCGRISINLTGSQFGDEHLLDDIKSVVQRHATPPACLEFEITESMVMHNRDRAIAIMDGIRAEGFTISIDDFGTGYSSLAYLKRFPVNTLKIDKSFINDIPDDANSSAIVQAIIAMSHALNLKVVTEGVETEKQLRALREFGSDEYQGYYFSKPVPYAQFLQMLLLQQELTRQPSQALVTEGDPP
ncbi:EAL domain-containing protein [Herbaspirillum sp. RU 5E]|uniref:Bifunctional diguanylate cyclase/phosphodiesterase n=1 Tax=Herbaspirillum aquaticum TaxID=568783 RepID=A0A225SZQ5_9BURK|nr:MULTISPECIES: EAL domain-containing protein [Herbaspirillum]MBW9332256.1 EAL domain-containing protein [Herbaspirillum sp. RU 5E]MRT31601.1 EAL domain-containing protein [Herbaspirillum sp. CAH-3]OWY36829.1 bifunctional diguanylate cyclase/phosphodiesterase [Herbaspirillum aquaticum]